MFKSFNVDPTLFSDQIRRFIGSASTVLVASSSVSIVAAADGRGNDGGDVGGGGGGGGTSAAAAASMKRRMRMRVQAEEVLRVIAQPAYARMVQRFADTFTAQLARFTASLQDKGSAHLSSLCTRLDFNGYYSQQQQQSNISF